jgi:hypothetical protein
MFERNRIAGAAFGGIIGAALIIAAGWWYQPRLEDISEPSRKSKAEAEQQRADYDSSVVCHDDCKVVFDFGEAAEAPSGEQNANQSDAGGKSSENWEVTLQRRDLLAQERMAHWALWLAGLTAVGVVLIAGTFWEAMEATKAANAAADAARKTNDTTREIGEAQARAYLCADGGNIRIPTKGGVDLIWELQVRNVGNSPASQICFYPMIVFANARTSEPPTKVRHRHKLQIQILTTGMTSKFVKIETLRQIIPNEIDLAKNGWVQIYIAGNIVFHDVFKKRIRTKIAARGFLSKFDPESGAHIGILEPCEPDIWDETKKPRG